MTQLTYEDQVQGQAGDLGYLKSNNLILSYNVVTGDLIKPGLMVGKISADENGARLPNSSSIQMLGVAMRDLSQENISDSTFTYPQYSQLPVVRRGQVWVLVEEDVTPDDAVFVRFESEPEVFTITWDGDFVTSNAINGSINGVAITEVDFTSDQATTIAAVAAAIQALDSVATATVTDSREITVTGAVDAVDISTNATFTVTGGASQADETVANVTGPSEGTQTGIFRTDADTGSGATAVAVTNCKFLTNGSAGDIALLDLNIA